MPETPTTESAEPTGPAPRRPLSLLASEIYGSQFAGEVVPENEPENESEKADEGSDTGDTEQPESDAEGFEEDSEEGEAEASQEGAEETGESDDEPSISTLQELVEQENYDPEWVNSLKVPVKIDGADGEATIGDLVKSYQIGEAAEHRLDEAKTKAKSIVEEATKQAEQVNTQLAIASKLIQQIEKDIESDTASIDWSSLRENDPAEYSAKKNDIAERRQRLEKMKSDAADEYQNIVATQAEQTKADRQKLIDEQKAALLEKVPEWRDPKKAEDETAKLSEYLIGQGFSTDDIVGASDHRLIVMARKAMLYDAMKSNSNAARKKLRKVPKVMKPGTPKPQDQISRERVAEVRGRLKKTGSIDDALNVIRTTRRPA